MPPERTAEGIAFEAAMFEWLAADPLATPPGARRGLDGADCGPSPGALLRMAPVGGTSKDDELLDCLAGASWPPSQPPSPPQTPQTPSWTAQTPSWTAQREELVALYLVRAVDEIAARRGGAAAKEFRGSAGITNQRQK